MSYLRIEKVSKRYGGVDALDAVSLDVAAGSRTAVVGPSGSGKSTLLRIIAGFEAADSGRVALDGQVLDNGARAVPAHRRQIGIVSQDGALFPHLSVFDNVAFGLDAAMPDREARVRELMGIVELDASMLTRRPHQLSGGQQQRVALARALARHPRLMLLDEPFSALDAGLRDQMRRAVAHVLQQAGITAILVTHDQAEALSFADQVAVLRGGRLVQAGSPQDLYFRPRDRETAMFLGDGVILEARMSNGMADCVLGRIPVDTSATAEIGSIMIRPEQLGLAGEPTSQYGSVGCPGEITYVEFGGSAWTVAVSVAGGTPIRLKVNSSQAPRPGDRVRINVTGSAHLLEA